MLQHFITVVFRSIRRNFSYSIINIAGLALGIAVSLLIFLWVENELSYDDFHKNRSRLMQAWSHTYFKDHIESRGSVPPLIAEDLKSFSFVEKVTVGRGTDEQLLSASGAKINRSGRYIDQAFLEMFGFELLKGNVATVIKDPLSIVLSEATAKALFGDQDPMGKTVRLENTIDLIVTGIFKNIPKNSSFHYDYLLHLDLLINTTPWVKDCMTDRDCDWFRVWALLKPGVNLEQVNQAIMAKTNVDFDDRRVQTFLYPLERIHLHGSFEDGKEAPNDQSQMVFNVSMLAIGILVVACINFMNLSTARSERRAKEVGIRKISGSLRKQLIVQFLGESFMITFIAFVLAVLLVQLVLPLYRLWIDAELSIHYLSWKFWIGSFVMILITGTLAGSYPAFFLSSFKPVSVLKGKVNVGRNSIVPRKILVGFQFGLSVLLIFGSMVVYQQVQFGLNRQLGYSKENLITLPDNEQLTKNYDAIKEKLLSTGAIKAMVKTNSPITDIYEVNYLRPAGYEVEPLTCSNIFTTYDYCKTMGIRLLEGRDFSPEHPSDSSAIILNHTAVKLMGLINPIGQEILIGPDRYKLIGVMEDVLMTSPYDEVDPLYMMLPADWKELSNRANVTIRLTDLSQMADIEAVFKTYMPDYPFDYSFVEEDHAEKFGDIEFMASLTTWFAAMAIAISSLGLLGLAAFTAEQRTKEIGIRKILGATTLHLIRLISGDFIRLIAIAFIVAAPVGWWVVNSYLEQYAYRITIDWWSLPLSGLFLLLITMSITSSLAWKASQNNPTESLRTE